jgi:hypothetical protein
MPRNLVTKGCCSFGALFLFGIVSFGSGDCYVLIVFSVIFQTYSVQRLLKI